MFSSVVEIQCSADRYQSLSSRSFQRITYNSITLSFSFLSNCTYHTLNDIYSRNENAAENVETVSNKIHESYKQERTFPVVVVRSSRVQVPARRGRPAHLQTHSQLRQALHWLSPGPSEPTNPSLLPQTLVLPDISLGFVCRFRGHGVCGLPGLPTKVDLYFLVNFREGRDQYAAWYDVRNSFDCKAP